ncbi:hypothetical protein [uncultured Sphaerochaeta sp.]|uniref:COG3014 family protein n=1 Tax=uncultured Sphaerochaeta sp. TaxID=886478 RepID=UPI002A0A59B0|nr:hypothetical protein [uncultured Sphaerochaeta sp.]
MKKIPHVCLFFLILSLVSCSSVVDLSSTRQLYQQGNYSAAFHNFMENKDIMENQQGSLILNLDGGLLAHVDGQWDISNSMLTKSELEIQDKYTQSVTANIGSFLINDNTKDYQGEDFEDIYINVFKALNYIQEDKDEDALVELRRSIEKQSLLKSRYEVQGAQLSAYARKNDVVSAESTTYSTSFSSSALANYLTMVLARGNQDSSMFTYSLNQVENAFRAQPDLYPFALPTSLKQEGKPLAQGMARLNLVAFNGLAPEKKEAVESIYVSPFNYAKIAYPVMVAKRSRIHAIQITLNDKTSFQLEKIESINDIAIETFKARAALIRSKAITRSMVKSIGIAAYDSATEEAARKSNTQKSLASELLGLVFKIARDLSETADVRSSHFLPSTAWIGGISVEPGTYDIHVDFLDNTGRTVYSQLIANFEVSDSRTNLVEAVCPL